MGELKHLLEGWGADTKTALHGMMNDEEFYVRLLKEFAENTEIEALNNALDKENFKDAFSIAHDIKGTVATLGLKPLYKAIGKVVEDLRGVPTQKVYDDIEIVNLEYESFMGIMKLYLSGAS